MEETFTPEPAVPAQPQGIILTQEAQLYLLSAGKWARFLGILGFIGTAFIAICALFVGTMMSALSSVSPMGSFGMAGAMGGFMSFFYILIALFYFFVSLYIYQFGARVKEGVAFGSSETIANGLGKLKSVFKMIGIITIVILILYIFILIGVIVFASRIAHTMPSYN